MIVLSSVPVKHIITEQCNKYYYTVLETIIFIYTCMYFISMMKKSRFDATLSATLGNIRQILQDIWAGCACCWICCCAVSSSTCIHITWSNLRIQNNTETTHCNYHRQNDSLRNYLYWTLAISADTLLRDNTIYLIYLFVTITLNTHIASYWFWTRCSSSVLYNNTPTRDTQNTNFFCMLSNARFNVICNELHLYKTHNNKLLCLLLWIHYLASFADLVCSQRCSFFTSIKTHNLCSLIFYMHVRSIDICLCRIKHVALSWSALLCCLIIVRPGTLHFSHATPHSSNHQTKEKKKKIYIYIYIHQTCLNITIIDLS